MISITLNTGVPIYEQLKKTIIENTLLGILEPDEQLPSVRSLSKELGINPNTVQKAYRALESEGIIYSLSGKGSFISSDIQILPSIKRNAEKALSAAIEEALLAGLTKEEIKALTDSCAEKYRERRTAVKQPTEEATGLTEGKDVDTYDYI